MADIVLGIGTSHTPLLSLDPSLWETYALGDRRNPELAYPPEGVVLPWEQGKTHIGDDVRAKYQGAAPFAGQYERFQLALDTLADTLQAARPDITVIVSDDQDEWLFEDNMPTFAVCWTDSVPIIPMQLPPTMHPGIARAISAGYGDKVLDVPVDGTFGRYVIEWLIEHDFDVAHLRYIKPQYGGKVARRYPTPDGELQLERETEPRERGLPHGYSFVVKRLFNNQPRPILPVFQNTCYPPNQPTPRRAFDFGRAIGRAIREWDSPRRVAVVASGGLSHFVVDEELDRMLLDGLQRKDPETLTTLPRHRLHSATSESLNWVAVGGAMQDTDLRPELLDYVPVYRTEAGTGGGWAFMRWL
jgi:3-O-methylgallate 3,4-dioxygenase